MTATVIPPISSKIVNLNPGQGIALYSRGEVDIFELISSPIHPISFKNIGNIKNRIQRFGPYVDGATLKINSSSFEVLYEIGTSPNVKEMTAIFQLEEQPDFYESDGVMLASSLMRATIICNASTSDPVNLSLPSGSAIEAASQWDLLEVFRFVVINISSNADFTITNNEPGIFIFGNNIVPANTSATFGISKVDFETFGGAKTT